MITGKYTFETAMSRLENIREEIVNKVTQLGISLGEFLTENRMEINPNYLGTQITTASLKDQGIWIQVLPDTNCVNGLGFAVNGEMVKSSYYYHGTRAAELLQKRYTQYIDEEVLVKGKILNFDWKCDSIQDSKIAVDNPELFGKHLYIALLANQEHSDYGYFFIKPNDQCYLGYSWCYMNENHEEILIQYPQGYERQANIL